MTKTFIFRIIGPYEHNNQTSKREVPNFNFMDIKQQFVFLMINEDINIISFKSDIVFENVQMREKMV
jgi:hypothetical protein